MKNKNIKIFPIIDNIDDYTNGYGGGNGYSFGNGNGKGNGKGYSKEYSKEYGFLLGNGKTNIIYVDENGNKQY